MTKIRIAILLPRLSRFDAVSNDALAEQAVLKKHGIASAIFTESKDPAFVDNPDIRHPKELPSFLNTNQEAWILYHFATHWPMGEEILQNPSTKIILRYHNITPSHFFAPYYDGFADSCKQARNSLQGLLASTAADACLAASDYNRKELIEMGAKRVFVCPPFHPIDELLNTKADLDFLQNLRSEKTKNILSIGRLVPNKGLPLLLRSFAVFHKYLNPESRLLIVGREEERLASFNQEIHELLHQEEIQAAGRFTGSLTQSQLKAAFLGSDLYMQTSLHEGFCVPIVEAQAHAIPVLALARTAVPETTGDGGLLLKQEEPELFAAAIHKIFTDTALQKGLIDAGLRNYQERFSRHRIEESFLASLQQFQNGEA